MITHVRQLEPEKCELSYCLETTLIVIFLIPRFFKKNCEQLAGISEAANYINLNRS